MAKRITAWVERCWYQRQAPPIWMTPLSALFGWAARRRQLRYQAPGNSYRSVLPVIVIGNLTVGGTGKSPLAAWLVERLQASGYQPVIITRGYGGKVERLPLLVTAQTSSALCGDEPLMLARQTGVPVVVDPDRARAADWVAAEGLGNILVCDDGLQHYRLARDLELVVFDGERGAGNGALLPAGPLREPLARLATATAVVVNGEARHSTFASIRSRAPAFHTMSLEPRALRRLTTGERAPVHHLSDQTVHAVAGIGNPERFFTSLEKLDYRVCRHGFPDHHPFRLEDFPDDGLPVVMTAKDSVKCESFAKENWWVLEVGAEPQPGLAELIFAKLGATT